MINLQKHQLAAALECAGDRDRRGYLNGVALIVCASGQTYLAATDGSTAFVGRFAAEWVGSPAPVPFTLIIPRDTVKAAIKGKGAVRLSPAAADGRYVLGDSIFTPLEGRFPDLARVIPTAVSAEAGQYDPALLYKATRAARLWEGAKARYYRLHHNGEGAAVILPEGAIVAVMSIRAPKDGWAEFKAFDLS